jgi:hypothetical protein
MLLRSRSGSARTLIKDRTGRWLAWRRVVVVPAAARSESQIRSVTLKNGEGTRKLHWSPYEQVDPYLHATAAGEVLSFVNEPGGG